MINRGAASSTLLLVPARSVSVGPGALLDEPLLVPAAVAAGRPLLQVVAMPQWSDGKRPNAGTFCLPTTAKTVGRQQPGAASGCFASATAALAFPFAFAFGISSPLFWRPALRKRRRSKRVRQE